MFISWNVGRMCSHKWLGDGMIWNILEEPISTLFVCTSPKLCFSPHILDLQFHNYLKPTWWPPMTAHCVAWPATLVVDFAIIWMLNIHNSLSWCSMKLINTAVSFTAVLMVCLNIICLLKMSNVDSSLAWPCDKNGNFLKKPESDLQPLPAEPINDSSGNPWAPFNDRLEFDWAYYHYVCLQSSALDILEGLDLWRATIVKHSSEHPAADDILWHNADKLYKTIDSIQTGDALWKSHKLLYSGLKPQTPPRWMEETYELNMQDVLVVIEQQLDTPDFESQMQYIPYQEFNNKGHRVYSNLMSGDWASNQAVSPLVLSSMLSVGSSQLLGQDFAGSVYPWSHVCTCYCWKWQDGCLCCYWSSRIPPHLHFTWNHIQHCLLWTWEWGPPCRISANSKRFVPSRSPCFVFLWSSKSTLASKHQQKHPEFQRFCHQPYHWCLKIIFEPLKPYMEKYKVVKCPDGHFHHAIFGPGPYIADYPEQVWLAGNVYGWCLK